MLKQQLRFIRNKWHPLWRLRKMPAYRYLQRKLDFTFFTELPETNTKVAVKFLRDLSWVVNTENLEPEIHTAFKLVLELIKPKVFWDVGSNIGYYSWFVRQSPSIDNVVMFEPDPTNFALIQRTIAQNKIKNCEAINAAVSDQVGEITFVIDEASGATGSLEATSHLDDKSGLQAQYGMKKTITCRTVSIDSIVDKKPMPGFIKIDVEGAEHLVIAGANSYIKQYKPAMIIETSNQDLIRKLDTIGYNVFQIDNGNYLFVSADLKDITEEIKITFPLCSL